MLALAGSTDQEISSSTTRTEMWSTKIHLSAGHPLPPIHSTSGDQICEFFCLSLRKSPVPLLPPMSYLCFDVLVAYQFTSTVQRTND
jgi:hypothetical protein